MDAPLVQRRLDERRQFVAVDRASGHRPVATEQRAPFDVEALVRLTDLPTVFGGPTDASPADGRFAWNFRRLRHADPPPETDRAFQMQTSQPNRGAAGESTARAEGPCQPEPRWRRCL